MSGPYRVQLRRAKGWRMPDPDNTEKVDHTTRYGNPFIVHDKCKCGAAIGEVCRKKRRHPGTYIHVATAAEAVERFRATPRSDADVRQAREHLGGRNVACWCALDQPCHADVWLEIANG